MHSVWIAHQVGFRFPDRLEIHRLHRAQERNAVRVQVRPSSRVLDLPLEQLSRVDNEARELPGVDLGDSQPLWEARLLSLKSFGDSSTVLLSNACTVLTQNWTEKSSVLPSTTFPLSSAWNAAVPEDRRVSAWPLRPST